MLPVQLTRTGWTALVVYVAGGTLLLGTVPYSDLLAQPSWLVPMLWWALSIVCGAAFGRWSLLLAAPVPWLLASGWFVANERRWDFMTDDWMGGLIGIVVLAVFGITTGVLLRNMRPRP